MLTTSATYESIGVESTIVFRKHELPDLRSSELLLKVHTAGLNRADLLQRKGLYRPPEGETLVPGIEVAGEIVAIGRDVRTHEIGDLVCGVVSGGGFSEFAILDSEMAFKIPKGWNLLEAAAFPEAALTANEALLTLAQIEKGKVVVINAAASGVGTMLIKMASLLGAIVIATTTTESKAARLHELGAHHVIAGKLTGFADEVMRCTHDNGADALIDFLGGSYFNANVAAVRSGGRIILAGLLDGKCAQVDLASLISRRISVLPLTLRKKPEPEKREVTARFLRRWSGDRSLASLKPVIHSAFDFHQLDDAQILMESNATVGKIVIVMPAFERPAAA
ncbi:NAD(P)H-quinone oxidoreductase [Burkholderia stagnalis]|uniref:zinc-binding dehydrogenase n=1 Tax=Burkholderia stagnalis TaxID=1503054 RepID=UPI000F5E7D5F|nr:zinc-binding dehydrogenase [Burkholderia stagnalis]RQY11658.1 NAD(P)H-quinone oxidoreductase [Burkholderia stagnalis]